MEDYNPCFDLSGVKAHATEVDLSDEADMPSFAFDESKSIDENLADFLAHLEGYDAEFAQHLAANLNDSTVRPFNRASFNQQVATMLDTLPNQPKPES